MKMKRVAAYAAFGAALTLPVTVFAQESHEDAKAQVEAHQAKHHTKAKFVGGGAVGGAAVGAMAGGPTGALVGGAAGAGGGLIAHKIEKKHAIKKKEQTGTPYR